MRPVLILLLGAHLAYAGTHSLKYYYTAVSGDIDFPEFTAVGLVDDEQFMYFDSNIKKKEAKDRVDQTELLQGFITAQKWNNDRNFLESNKNYYSTVCIEWLQKYLQYGKSRLEKTGFYPSGITISWQKNGQEHYEDVEVGELLHNEDGNFQKTSTIRVTPDEWKNNKLICVVKHQGKTKTANAIRTNGGKRNEMSELQI
ncbi:hypothetical protein Q8A67_015891 [Cirrhinus molitorella]|uniref:Immunoglobulin C1-set domain-containing protein n=1 Tax=Cirrhinus molitorella TaxID=172907 RepID=A0AA88PFL4_9TELE|nr:hypothetical protein Q8A67_015891 [Cirrhinus molitorella]